MCGVLGLLGHPEAKQIFPRVLLSLQHRGYDGAGVAGLVAQNPDSIDTVKGVGKIPEIVNDVSMSKFIGDRFIGHTRYSTRNESKSHREMHPHWAQAMMGRIAIVTNGDLLNVEQIRNHVQGQKVKTYTSNDAEMMAALINIELRQNGKDMMRAIQAAMQWTKGGFAALVMSEDDDHLYAFRDPWGIRPLHVCEFEMQGKKSVAVASETCAFDLIERYNLASYDAASVKTKVRAVNPGEILAIGPDAAMESISFSGLRQQNIGCVFETIYFSRPDSRQNGETFQSIRERMGAELYHERPVSADLVTAVPKGGIPAAVGYAKASGIPYSIAILEEPTMGGLRSFIFNSNDRLPFARMKYNVLEDVVRGKRVVVIDDSIVRGTTLRLLIKSLWDKGAAEVHVRIPAPPYDHPCYYGIETKDPKTLISHGRTEEEVGRVLEASSLHYLSLEGLYQAIGKSRDLFCDECLSAKSPIQGADLAVRVSG